MAARGCKGGVRSTDTLFVTKCNAEIDKMNEWHDRLKERKSQLDVVQAETQQRRATLSEEVTKWSLNVKASNALRNDLDARRKVIQARLDEIKKMVDTCKEMLRRTNPRVSDEELKLRCGNEQFDGADPKLPPLNR